MYGAYPYAGAPYAGSGSTVVDVTVTPSPLTLAVEVIAPINIVSDSFSPGTQPLNLSVDSPSYLMTVVPNTLTSSITLNAPNINIAIAVGTATLPMTASVLAPSIHISMVIRPQIFLLNLKSPKSPDRFELSIRVVRYIKDPIVTGGCPQCGTFLYKNKGRYVRSEAVHTGRSQDRGVFDDRKQIKCGRCGFICFTQRDISQPEGSRTGWGMKYDEIEAGS